jgi:hypothetical protein
LKEEALDRTVWRARFGRGFRPVVRQTNNEWTLWLKTSLIVKWGFGHSGYVVAKLQVFLFFLLLLDRKDEGCTLLWNVCLPVNMM